MGLRILEIIIYSLLNVIPYKILLIQPFYHSRRFSNTGTALMIALAWGAETVRFFAVAMWGLPEEIAFIIHIVIGLIFCMIVFTERIGKTFLTFLILMSFMLIVIALSKCAEGIFFPQNAVDYFRWSHSLCMLPIEFIALSLDAMYSVKVYTKAINTSQSSVIWKFLWIIPLTSIVIWYMILFLSGESYIVMIRRIDICVWMSIITGGFWFTDYLIAKFAIEQNNLRLAEKKVEIFNEQQWHYQNMNKRIDDARRARHDLRHHLRIAQNYLDNGKLDELKIYLQKYEQILPNDTLSTFCANYAANAVLTYYQQRCIERGVEYNAVLDLPEKVPFSDHDLVVLLGNLVENAADAALEAKKVGKEAKVSVEGMFDGNSLIVNVENTVAKQPKIDSEGRIRSTKRDGYGIGVISVRQLVEETGGTMNINQHEDVFATRVILNQNHRTAG